MAKVKEKKKVETIIIEMLQILEGAQPDALKCDEGNAAAGKRVRVVLKPMKEKLKELKLVSLGKE